MFSHNVASGPKSSNQPINQSTGLFVWQLKSWIKTCIEVTRWRHRGRRLPSSTASCLKIDDKAVFAAQRYASAVYAVIVCPSVCPSVRLSIADVLLRQLYIGSRKQRLTISQGLRQIEEG